MPEDITDKLNKNEMKSFKDLVRLSEKYETLMIDKNIIIGCVGNHSMLIVYSGNKY